MRTAKERFLAHVRAHPYLNASFGIGLAASGAMLSELHLLALLGKAPPLPLFFPGLGAAVHLVIFALSVLPGWVWVFLVIRTSRSTS